MEGVGKRKWKVGKKWGGIKKTRGFFFNLSEGIPLFWFFSFFLHFFSFYLAHKAIKKVLCYAKRNTCLREILCTNLRWVMDTAAKQQRKKKTKVQQKIRNEAKWGVFGVMMGVFLTEKKKTRVRKDLLSFFVFFRESREKKKKKNQDFQDFCLFFSGSLEIFEIFEKS